LRGEKRKARKKEKKTQKSGKTPGGIEKQGETRTGVGDGPP